jgi:poly(hydroxyalkanoate) depolymerase family esterase
MNFNLARAMREATELTRARKLAEATRVIQDALAGRRPDGSVLPEGATSDGSQRTEEVRQVEHAAQVERAPQGGVRAESADSDQPHLSGRLGQRLKRSLGEVVTTLRQAKLRGLPPNPLPGVKPHGTPKIPEGAQFLTRSFSARAGSRTYKLYLPQSRPARGLPLVVMLHGCTQDPDDFALGSRMNGLAEEFGFLVAYPSQPGTANPSSCWNWFAPKDQMRGAGEPSIIAGLTNDIVAQYDLDPHRIFIAGLSAGGAMATVMGATYPDVYAAIGVHSGLAYGSATDVVSAYAAMRGDPVPGRKANAGNAEDAARARAIVFHGEADLTVHPSNAARIVEACDRRDGDLREVESGVSGGRRYTRTIIRDQSGSSRVEHWLVHGAGHAWSGGSPDGSFADAAGPDASREMVRFFLQTEATYRHDQRD